MLSKRCGKLLRYIKTHTWES